MKHFLLPLLTGILALAPLATAQTGDLMDPSTLDKAPPAVYVVRLETTKGIIDIRVESAQAPNGARRFYNLVRGGFYNNTYFFRNLDFMVQAGVSSDPKISKVWSTRRIRDDRPAASNQRGTVTFASRSEPNTRSTQFFINKMNNARLDPLGFQPFGEVINGMDVVGLLYAGYGESPDQTRIEAEGEPFLNRYYPRLDRIVKAEVLPAP